MIRLLACLLVMGALALTLDAAPPKSPSGKAESPASEAAARFNDLSAAATMIAKMAEKFFDSVDALGEHAFRGYQAGKAHEERQILITKLREYVIGVNDLARLKRNLAAALSVEPPNQQLIYRLATDATESTRQLTEATSKVTPLLPTVSEEEGQAAMKAFESAIGQRKGFLIILDAASRNGRPLRKFSEDSESAAEALENARDKLNDLISKLAEIEAKKVN